MSTTVHNPQPIRSRFSDEGASLKSAPDHLPSNPPALKGRKPFLPVASLFARSLRGIPSRGTIKVSGDIKAKDSTVIEPKLTNEKAVDTTSQEEPTSASAPPRGTITNMNAASTPALSDTRPLLPQSTHAQSPKSKAMLRRFRNKFRNITPPAGSPASIPEPSNSRGSRELREAALRARGLLPPKDLSAQEQEQDRSLAVISPVSDGCSGGSTDSDGSETAASQIKRAWESKNNNIDPAQLERMNNFKFGRPSEPASSDSLVQPELEPVAEVDTPPRTAPPSAKSGTATLPGSESTPSDLAISTRAPPTRALPVSPSDPDFPTSIPLPPSPATPSKDEAHTLKRTALNTNEKLTSNPFFLPLPPSPLLSFSPHDGTQTPKQTTPITSEKLTGDPYSVPLPQSPLPLSTSDGAQTPKQKALGSTEQLALDVLSIPLPTSPLSHDSPAKTPRSFRSPVNDSTDSPTPKLGKTVDASSSTPNLLSSNPLVFVTPPASPHDTTPRVTQDDSALARNRSSSLPPLPSSSESEFSVPSLCFDTGSTTTSESSPVTDKGRMGGLKVRVVHENGVNNIPVIVESPVEGENAIPQSDSSLEDASPVKASLIDEKSPDSGPRPRTNIRGFTLPITKGKPERKKSINIFRRGQTFDSSAPPSHNPNRLSISNIRRSVVGTLSRPKANSPVNQKVFDASHLPPSPTLPPSLASPDQSNLLSVKSRTGTNPGVVAPPRMPIGPTIHSRGTILHKADEIQDDEIRRLSELAFLG